MRCSKVRKMMSCYLDGELSTSGKLLISRHVETCPACRRELDELHGAMELIHRLPEASVPPSFWNQVSGQLDSAGKSGDQRKQSRKLIPWFITGTKVRTGLALAAALTLILSFTSWWWYTQSDRQISSNHIDSAKGNGTKENFQIAQSSPKDSVQVTPLKNGQEKTKKDEAAKPVTETAAPQEYGALSSDGEENRARAERDQQTGASQNTDTIPQIKLKLPSGLNVKPQKMLARRVQLDLEVDDRDKAYTMLSSLVQKRGGKIMGVSFQTMSPLEIEVPASQMQETLDEIESIGSVSNKKVEDMDLTTEYANTLEKLNQLRQQEKQLLAGNNFGSDLQDEDALTKANSENVKLEITKAENTLKNMEENINMVNIRLYLH